MTREFWLDGGGSREWSGRRSLVGRLTDDDVSLTYDAARRVVTEYRNGRDREVGDDIFTVLADSLDGDPATHWVGYLGYAARPDLPARPADGVPDAIWMCTRDVTIHETGRVLERPPQQAPQHSAAPEWYVAAFEEVQRQLRAGNTYEVNLTHRVESRSAADPRAAYDRLRRTSPAPYAGYLSHHGTHLLSASPERFATITRDRFVETRPIKGTTPRGATPGEDAEHRNRLATDPKYRAENLMIVDLLRNDLSMVCEPGTVEVPALMEVESYATVHQLVSTVRGHLRDGVGTVDALRALFPAGSMTGAPKLRTMQVIDAVEATPRGAYAGAFGWLSGDGRADLGVVIRSLVRTAEGRWLAGTGGGITVRSAVDEEWAETQWKVERLLGVLDLPDMG